MNDSTDGFAFPDPDSDQIIGEIHASPGRRILGLVSFGGAAVLLAYCGLALPHLPVENRLLLGMLALGAAALGWKMQDATRAHLVLTAQELRSSTGDVLARLDDIRRVERGMLAMKPSNGFALRLETKQPWAWHPGLWTRWGRRVYVGGVTLAGADPSGRGYDCHSGGAAQPSGRPVRPLPLYVVCSYILT